MVFVVSFRLPSFAVVGEKHVVVCTDLGEAAAIFMDWLQLLLRIGVDGDDDDNMTLLLGKFVRCFCYLDCDRNRFIFYRCSSLDCNRVAFQRNRDQNVCYLYVPNRDSREPTCKNMYCQLFHE